MDTKYNQYKVFAKIHEKHGYSWLTRLKARVVRHRLTLSEGECDTILVQDLIDGNIKNIAIQQTRLDNNEYATAKQCEGAEYWIDWQSFRQHCIDNNVDTIEQYNDMLSKETDIGRKQLLKDKIESLKTKNEGLSINRYDDAKAQATNIMDSLRLKIKEKSCHKK